MDRSAWMNAVMAPSMCVLVLLASRKRMRVAGLSPNSSIHSLRLAGGRRNQLPLVKHSSLG